MNGDEPTASAGPLPWPQAAIFVMRTIETILLQQSKLEDKQQKTDSKVNIGIGIMLVMQIILTLVGGAILARLP